MNNQKRNLLVYFFVYFAAQLIYIYINAYLPIYFKNVSSIENTKLALVLFTSYSFMFAKPLISIYIDHRGKSKQIKNKKPLMLIGVLGATISFIIFILSLELLIIFGIFLGINFIFVSLMDVVIDKIIVEQSSNDIIKNKNVLFMQLGAIVGAIFPNIYNFIIAPKTSIQLWIVFFIAGILSLIPLLPVISLLKEENVEENANTQKISEKKPIILKSIALMCIFLFFAYGTNLYDWVLEPWAVNLVGNSLFSIFMILFIILNAISLIIAGKITYKYDRKKILLISVCISGILTSIAPSMNIYIFFILVSIVQLISGFFLINMITIMIDLSHTKVIIFQIMAAFAILAKVILAPLGVFLSGVITSEFIIMIAGVLQLISIIPIYLIGYNNK